MRIVSHPVATVKGVLRPPSDKSLTHRALMLAACADGPSEIDLPLDGEDPRATAACLAALGCGWERSTPGVWRIVPRGPWRSPGAPLDCGNSGTTMRLLSGLIAARPVTATLTGDESLSRRPMRRIAEPLRAMGAAVEGDHAPLTIKGGGLRGIDYASPVASAQVKSCVLLAGLGAEGETRVTEPVLSRDHTERMLRALGVPVRTRLAPDGASPSVAVCGGARWGGFRYRVPGDLSSAAFWMVAAACLPEAEVTLAGVGVNPTRAGMLEVLRQTGASCHLSNEGEEMGEPVADITVRGGASLKPFTVAGPLVPRLIDEIPALAVLATRCDGVSVIRDAGELRVKESDRIAATAAALRAMGAAVETFDDGLAVMGPVRLRGAHIDAHGDHRAAMAFAVAGLLARGPTTIDGAQGIATSYPAFEADLWSLCIV
jgi:3-phosphoshikimate 1-carboxyvinyltransferase